MMRKQPPSSRLPVPSDKRLFWVFFMLRVPLLHMTSAHRAYALSLVLLMSLNALTGGAMAGDKRVHALSLVDPPQYASGFQHFDWVNPDAPKGGKVRLRGIGTFDTLNAYAIKGSPPLGLGMLYDQLLAGSLDEPSAEYGLVAEWVSHDKEFSRATFGLRKEARFHDGKPMTADDVVFSLSAIKAANPRYALYYQNVVKAEANGSHEVTFTFEPKGNRELPLIIGGLPVLPRHYWTGKGENGELRDLAKSTMEVPLGSGPYRVQSVEGGRQITYERVKDWWAKDLPVSRGQWNFDQITYVYYRDRLPAFEGFKAGETDFWPENSAKGWATGYEIEPVRRDLIRRDLLPSKTIAPMQGFAFNTRRKQFQDARVRQAFNLCFNFEWANKNLFFDQYARVGSYFENSELKATGLPEGRELEILDGVRKDVPPEVFAQVWANPVYNQPEDVRRNMGRAAKLLAEAGYSMKNGVLTSAAGEKLTAEFLLVQPDFERLVLAYKAELERLGMKIDIRTVDAAQYRRRIDTFDFDVVVASFPQSLSPGNEQRDFWGSAAAIQEGTRNIIGIKNTAIDQLIDRLIFATDRADLVAATRALDRVLLWSHFVVPHFYSPNDRIAYWDKFRRPKKLPGQASATNAFIQTWWYDEDRAAKLADARRQ